MPSTDFIWTFISFIFTLLIFSYLLGDNPLFRIATYVFIGVSAGYVSVCVVYYVLLPRLILPMVMGPALDQLITVPALLLGALLLFKLLPGMSRLGNLPMAFLVGAGAAVTIGGVIAGTLFEQTWATISLFDTQAMTLRNINLGAGLLEGVFVLFGVIATLAYFHFGAPVKAGQPVRRFFALEGLAGIGGIFIAVTLGSLFAGVFAAAITALVERLHFLISFVLALF